MHYTSQSVRSTRRGFTIVELMVVIAIIGILTAIATVSYNEARKSARDKERITSLEQVRLALEVYRQAHGRYPTEGCGEDGWTGAGTEVGNCDEYIDGIDTILDSLPVDSTRTDYGYIYATNGAGSEYKLMNFLGVESETVTADHEYARCEATCGQSYCQASNSGFQSTYAVYSPGAACW